MMEMSRYTQETSHETVSTFFNHADQKGLAQCILECERRQLPIMNTIARSAMLQNGGEICSCTKKSERIYYQWICLIRNAKEVFQSGGKEH